MSLSFDKKSESPIESNNYMDPRNYNLTEDFIYIDQEWGSMFYKHIGKMNKTMAKQECLKYGDSVHLPVPRFADENKFYQKHFGNTSLWLDISYDADNGGVKSVAGHLFTDRFRTVTGMMNINKYKWMNTINTNTITDVREAIITNSGEWKFLEENEFHDSVCVYNILPDESCRKCPDMEFCRFKDKKKHTTECVCSNMKYGRLCLMNSCKKYCRNSKFCEMNDQTKQVNCACQYPLQGPDCNISKFLNLTSFKFNIKIFSGASQYNLTNDFIYTNQSWGSFFYKLIGKHHYDEAKKVCLEAGKSVHLPVPRFLNENEFYRSLIPEQSIWLDVSYSSNLNSDQFKSTDGRLFSTMVRTVTEEIKIDHFELINFNFTDQGSGEVILTKTGNWKAVTDHYEWNDSICVFDTKPSGCKCSNDAFCRYTDPLKNKTQCICPKTRKGDHCEVDLCSKCQNGGYCTIDDETNETQCVCPRPFDGKYCEVNLCPHCKNGGYCEGSSMNHEPKCICSFAFIGKYCQS